MDNKLLAEIQKGKGPKKIVTNDRSGPILDGAKKSAAGGAGAISAGLGRVTGGGSSGSVPGGAGPPQLGGLLAGGIPKLKPAGQSNLGKPPTVGRPPPVPRSTTLPAPPAAPSEPPSPPSPERPTPGLSVGSTLPPPPPRPARASQDGIGPPQLAGLFAAGIPKLKPAGQSNLRKPPTVGRPPPVPRLTTLPAPPAAPSQPPPPPPPGRPTPGPPVGPTPPPPSLSPARASPAPPAAPPPAPPSVLSPARRPTAPAPRSETPPDDQLPLPPRRVLPTPTRPINGSDGSNPPTASDDDIGHLITTISNQAICTNGGFGDIFKGVHRTMGEVALKRLKLGGTDNAEQLVRRFEREAYTWRRLHHSHILKFLGVLKLEGHLYFVSPFINNGTLLEYIKSRPGTNRVRLLCQTANAVQYLHQEGVVHGDIKGGNLLISDDGQVLLCDFGLTKSIDAQTSTALMGAGTVRWQSPELWDNAPRTPASDVYAFSMTIAEVITGLPPFPHLQAGTAVIAAVYLRNERPEKSPMNSGDGVSYENAWKVAEAGWLTLCEDRIPMAEAFCRLSKDPSLL